MDFPEGGGGGGGNNKPCFPSFAKVRFENGKLVMMSELQKDDKVQTGRVLQF